MCLLPVAALAAAPAVPTAAATPKAREEVAEAPGVVSLGQPCTLAVAVAAPVATWVPAVLAEGLRR